MAGCVASERMRETRFFLEMEQLQEPQSPAAVKSAESVLRTVSANSGKGEGWKLVTPAPHEGLQLWDRFATLQAEEELGVLSSKVSRPTKP